MGDLLLGFIFTDTDYRPTQYNFGGVTVTVSALNAASTDFDRTGDVVWPSAEHLALYLVNHELSAKRILEVGSGHGLSGIATAKMRPDATVVITDGDDSCVELMERNIEQNGLQNRAVAAKLEWGDLECERDVLNIVQIDKFDLIIGADVVFRESWIMPLLQSIKRLGSRAVLVFQSRSLHAEAKFRDCIVELGLELHEDFICEQEFIRLWLITNP